MKICQIPANKSECENIKQKCKLCKYKDECDYPWLYKLWDGDNTKRGENALLSPAFPPIVKSAIRDNQIITVTGKYDFCFFSVPKNKNIIVINDIFVDENLRGQQIAKQLLNYLMDIYDRDIFAKCVANTSAQDFWEHIGEQVVIDNSIDNLEHRKNHRNLAWYIVKNNNKQFLKKELF